MASNDVRQKVFRVPRDVVLSVGLTWEYIGATPVDLDLSAVCFSKEGQLLDVVFFNHLFPEGTDEEALRSEYLIDPDQLPYMFLSGDSRVGGEEENQMSGLELASRRRKNLLSARNRPGKRNAAAAAESLFNRLYDEEELAGVQEAMDDYYANGGEILDENGVLVNRRPRREMCDEVLTFVPGKIPSDAEVIFLAVSSYTGQDFTSLAKVRLVVHNETTNERVGTMDLKATTGSGTANLAAMLVRVPDDGDGENYWDLREVNVRTFGYSFVDVLPLMLDVMGVPNNSRRDALMNLPDYPLLKDRTELLDQPLSDLRFGLGWDGEHDLDAFLVMLDEQNNYVDHVYPKHGKVRSAVEPDMARHSGDALTGQNTKGDEEFVDLLTYRVPSNVRTILLGCTYMESFGARKADYESIYDVPNLYMRLQNRTLLNPFSFEVDRWDVRKEYERKADNSKGEADDGKGKNSKKNKRERIKTTYKAADKTSQPVRTLLLGVLLKKGTVPFEALFPDGRRIDQHFRRHHTASRAGGGGYYGAGPDDSVARGASESRQTVLEAQPDEEVPLFELVPIHQHVPVDPRGGFGTVIPFLQCVSAFLCGSGAANPDGTENNNTALSMNTTSGGGRRRPQADASRVLDRESNMVGWDHSTRVAVGGQAAVAAAYAGIWDTMQEQEKIAECYAIEVRFMEVVALEPQLPDRFKCHGEAWVCGQSDTINNAGVNRPFKTPFLVNRNRMRWDGNTDAAACVFVVHKYDRVRVMLYEYAAFGYADIDLMQMGELWQGEGRPVECNVALLGAGQLFKGEVKVRLTRVPYKQNARRLQREADRVADKREAKAKERQQRQEAAHNSSYTPCTVM